MKNLHVIFIILIVVFNSQFVHSSTNLETDSIIQKTQQFLQENPDSCLLFIQSNPQLYKKNEVNYFEGLIFNKTKAYKKSNSLLFESIHNNLDYSNINFSSVYYYIALNYYHLDIVDSAIYFFKKEMFYLFNIKFF